MSFLRTFGAVIERHWTRVVIGFIALIRGRVALAITAYAGVGLIAAALVVSFRTNAAIPQGVLVLSTLLGGVYFPTSVLPAAVAPLAEWIPLTPALRALRQALLLGYPLSDVTVGPDGRIYVLSDESRCIARLQAVARVRRRRVVG